MCNMVFSKTGAIFHFHNSLLESTDTQQPLCCHGAGQGKSLEIHGPDSSFLMFIFIRY